MASNPELNAQLEHLEAEFREGDITQKGYEKRRTMLFDQYNNRQSFNPYANELSSNPPVSTLYLQQQPQQQPPQPPIYHQPQQYQTACQQQYQQQPQQRQQQQFLSPNDDYNARTASIMSLDYRFNPPPPPPPQNNHNEEDTVRLNTLDSAQGYFSDFAGHQEGSQRESYGGPLSYSNGEELSTPLGTLYNQDPQLSRHPPPPQPSYANQDTENFVIAEYQLPLEPREIMFDAQDPHSSQILMSQFPHIGAVLRHRARTNPKEIVFRVLDNKGKDLTSITFEKLAAKAEKLAYLIGEKYKGRTGFRVALIYRDYEYIDFAVALFACFLVGVVAVPTNGIEKDSTKLPLLLKTTQANLALTTDENLQKFTRDVALKHFNWPIGVEWWKTNEFGSHSSKKKESEPPTMAADLAYIEFSRAPVGDLRGVVLLHRTIMHQMSCIQSIMSSIPADSLDTSIPANTFSPPRSRPETILNYLDPREGVGMLFGILYTVYGGHTSIYLPLTGVEVPGLYAYIITKYSATILLADYPGLRQPIYNYQLDPMATRKYKTDKEPNLSTVKICLIDSLTTDSEFHDVLADRWFTPLRNPRARELVAPILCLPEHGGMIISMRDWLGGEDRMGCPISLEDEKSKSTDPTNHSHSHSSLVDSAKASRSNSRTDLSEVLLDKEALVRNEVRVLAVGAEAAKRAKDNGPLRVGAFGYPIPDATLAVVNPENNLLCAPYSIGEIWVDSPSLSGGFWALPKHTETIFHATAYRFIEENPNPVLIEPEFLRTGLLGFVFEGKVFVLGLYEDRIRQRIDGSTTTSLTPGLDHRYYFTQHIVQSILKNVPPIFDCSAFDILANGEYLPVIVLETALASTAPLAQGGSPNQIEIPTLLALSERVMEVLLDSHNLRVYCVLVSAPNSLPRITRNGRKEIGNMLCRNEFRVGNLAAVCVKFGVDKAIPSLPVGDDPIGGIWSPLATQLRGNVLMIKDKQYSGVDHREVVIDDRTSAPLNQFSNIQDLLQYRVTRHPDELSYCTVDARLKEGKGISWKKLDQKIAAVAMYLRNKLKIQPGEHVVLMYTHSEDFVNAVHACMLVGVIAIPMGPLDYRRLNEDAPALLHIIADYRIKAILVNNDVDSVMNKKEVSQHLRQSATVLRINLPPCHNTSRPPKQTHSCRELSLIVKPAWTRAGHPVIVWVYWTPDQRRIAVQLGHDTLMALCKVQKETCQMPSSRPVVGCIRSTTGLGFIHTCLIGIYLASPTYLVSPIDYAANPSILFHVLSRYKVKDTYATSQSVDYAIAQTNMQAGKNQPTASGLGKNYGMLQLRNLMLTTENRPKMETYLKVLSYFAKNGLDRTAINTIYSHVLNPMITSRSYMSIEPIELWLDRPSLRRGIISPVHPEKDSPALRLVDSGMVPVSTQICIVNPETCCLSVVGEIGEIWVQSEANVHSFYLSRDPLDQLRFDGRTLDGDSSARYLRTGDIGFLHNVSRPVGPNGGIVEMQVLFVLGSIGDTFEINGLLHFPVDIEASVEECHKMITTCAIFRAGGHTAIVVEVGRKFALASLVPVIVNCILNQHHFVVDIVTFVEYGQFLKSRLGEKQRGKILAAWVTRKLRMIGQFVIRDEIVTSQEAAATKRQSGITGSRGSRTSTGLLQPTASGSLRAGLQANGQLHGYERVASMGNLDGHHSMETHNHGPLSLSADFRTMSIQNQPQQAPLAVEVSAAHVHRRPVAAELYSNLAPMQSYAAELHSTPVPMVKQMASTLPQNEFHTELPAAYGYDRLIPELDSQSNLTEYNNTLTAPRPLSFEPLNVYELAGESSSAPSHAPHTSNHYGANEDSTSSLVDAAQNLAGSFLPPSAIADLQKPNEFSGFNFKDDIGKPLSPPPIPLPSYANKPYFTMLTKETGRQGYIPGGGRRSNPNSRPSSRAGSSGEQQQRATTMTSYTNDMSTSYVSNGGVVRPPLSTIHSEQLAPHLSNGSGTDEDWSKETLRYMSLEDRKNSGF